MMERAAAGVVTASSKVLSALKALERAESASETALDWLDDAIDGLASAHASLILAFGHAGDRPASPPTAADWSRTLNRVSLALAGPLRGDKAVADVVLHRPADHKELAQKLIDRGVDEGVLTAGKATDVISAVRADFVATARDAIATGRSGRAPAGAGRFPESSSSRP